MQTCIFPLLMAWTSSWLSGQVAGDLRCHDDHVTNMTLLQHGQKLKILCPVICFRVQPPERHHIQILLPLAPILPYVCLIGLEVMAYFSMRGRWCKQALVALISWNSWNSVITCVYHIQNGKCNHYNFSTHVNMWNKFFSMRYWANIAMEHIEQTVYEFII